MKTSAEVGGTPGPAQLTEFQQFLYEEAAMLDEWRLDDWFALFAEGATYEVPQAGAADDVSSTSSLFYISDNYFRLRHRVARLQKTGNHSEWPRSVCSRIVSNIRILDADESGTTVSSKFITHRSKNNNTDVFCGRHFYRLLSTSSGIRILTKRTQIDMNSLRPQGRVSIIL